MNFTLQLCNELNAHKMTQTIDEKLEKIEKIEKAIELINKGHLQQEPHDDKFIAMGNVHDIFMFILIITCIMIIDKCLALMILLPITYFISLPLTNL